MFFWCGVCLFLFGAGQVLDRVIFPHIVPLHGTPFDAWTVFFTEKLYYWGIGLFLVLVLWRVVRNPSHHSKLVPAFYALITAGIVVSVLKYVFRIPRPYAETDLVPLVLDTTYSFPSSHVAVVFALLIPLWRASWVMGLFWGLFSLGLGALQVYQLAHYPSDIAMGVFLGGAIGAIYSHPEVHRMLHETWKDLEFRRQTFHFMVGFLAVFLHWKELLTLWQLAAILIVGLVVSLYSQYRKIPVISHCLERFDRPRDKNFPGRGAFYYFLAMFLCFLIWNNVYSELRIAYSAILILAVGDSLNHLVAQSFPQYPIPWNQKKTIVGVLFGIAAGTFAAQFFVGWFPALLATTLALLVETIPWRIGKFYIDDNLTVPLVAGAVLHLCLVSTFVS